MSLTSLVESLNSQIALLEQARNLLQGEVTAGKPRQSKRHRYLNTAARAAISKAQKKRWAKAKSEKTQGLRPIPVKNGGIKGYWAKMTQEQRDAEMARRRASGLGRKAA